MAGEGNVLQHDEQVSDGEAGEHGISGGGHLATRQHGDVQSVGYGAEHADEEADVAVQLAVLRVHLLETCARGQA